MPFREACGKRPGSFFLASFPNAFTTPLNMPCEKSPDWCLKGFASDKLARAVVYEFASGPFAAAPGVSQRIPCKPAFVQTSILFSIIIFSGFWMHVKNCFA
jgi:hypothetical protein